MHLALFIIFDKQPVQINCSFLVTCTVLIGFIPGILATQN